MIRGRVMIISAIIERFQHVTYTQDQMSDNVRMLTDAILLIEGLNSNQLSLEVRYNTTDRITAQILCYVYPYAMPSTFSPMYFLTDEDDIVRYLMSYLNPAPLGMWVELPGSDADNKTIEFDASHPTFLLINYHFDLGLFHIGVDQLQMRGIQRAFDMKNTVKDVLMRMASDPSFIAMTEPYRVIPFEGRGAAASDITYSTDVPSASARLEEGEPKEKRIKIGEKCYAYSVVWRKLSEKIAGAEKALINLFGTPYNFGKSGIDFTRFYYHVKDAYSAIGGGELLHQTALQSSRELGITGLLRCVNASMSRRVPTERVLIEQVRRGFGPKEEAFFTQRGYSATSLCAVPRQAPELPGPPVDLDEC